MMHPKAVLLCFGLAIACVSSFTGGTGILSRSASIGVTRAPVMMAASSDSQADGRRRRSFSSPKRKIKTIMGASSLPISFPKRAPIHVRLQSLLGTVSSKIRNADEVTKWRMAAATFISSIILFRPAIDANLVKFWHYLQTSSGLLATCFRHDHWEWMLAVSAFFVWIHGFWAADKAVLHAAKQGRVHPWRKFRLQDRYEAQKFRREQERKRQRVEDVGAEQPPLLTKQTEWNWKAWIFELPLYVVPLFLWDYLIPRRAAKIAAWGAPTTLQICRDVTCGLLLYDAFFFCGHVIMHKVPFIFNTVHKKHHINTECRAAEIVRLSLVEEVLEVGMSIVALNYLKAHPVSRSIYNVIITFLLTELHCGFDFPWTPQNVVPFGLATGSRRHHYHHRNGRHYYQKFFCHVDRLFGFYQKNDGSLLGDSVQKFKDVPSSWINKNKK